MENISPDRTGEQVRPAPPQILKHERGFAIFLASIFFMLWALPVWGALLIPAILAYVALLKTEQQPRRVRHLLLDAWKHTPSLRLIPPILDALDDVPPAAQRRLLKPSCAANQPSPRPY